MTTIAGSDTDPRKKTETDFKTPIQTYTDT